MMLETCKTCRQKLDSGIWISPQFRGEKVLLFCSEKCKNKYLKMKLERIKVQYPKYYEKIKKLAKSSFRLDKEQANSKRAQKPF